MEDSDEEAGASQREHHDDSDGSSEFGFGKEEKPKAKAKAPQKADPKRLPASGRQPKAEKAAQPASEKQDKKVDKSLEKSKQSMDQANKVLGSLAALTPMVLWKGAFKEGEVSARLKKALGQSTTLSQLATSCSDPQLKEQMEALAKNIDKKGGEINDIEEIVRKIKSSKQVLPILSEEAFANKLSATCEIMDGDCLGSVLLFLGQKLAEDRMGLDFPSFIHTPTNYNIFCFLSFESFSFVATAGEHSQSLQVCEREQWLP